MAKKQTSVSYVETPQLDRVIASQREGVAVALQSSDWAGALNATCGGILWRSLRLGMKIGTSSASFDPSVGWRVLAVQLRIHCISAFESSATAENGEGDYRIECIIETLDALMEVIAFLEGGKFATAVGAQRLTLLAGNLGRCEMMLGFAEEGFWEQVYQWRARKVGRPPGSYANWKEEKLAPHLNDWMKSNPDSTVEERIDEIENWLSRQRMARSRDAAKSAYYQMKKARLINAPTNVRAAES
jgi:hypothetical protein